MKLITTSWDDGYPKDLKLAELLNKYNLAGTFYIPKTNAEHVVMDENAIVELAKKFEIGGHTLNHVRLYNNKSAAFLKNETEGCFNWLNGLTASKAVSFCLPGGVVNKAAIASVYQAGFKVIRTTELLSTSLTSTYNLLPTTLQLFDHPKTTYFKNTVKRHQYKSLLFWLSTLCSTDLFKLIDFYLNRIIKDSGCFHLWGHSWEIDEYNLWSKAEAIFKHLSGISDFRYIQNKELISI